MFYPSLFVVVSISLPNHSDFVKPNKYSLYDYYISVPESQNKNTLEYNYITNEEFIKSGIIKYQDILQ